MLPNAARCFGSHLNVEMALQGENNSLPIFYHFYHSVQKLREKLSLMCEKDNTKRHDISSSYYANL